jgi:hypothetical protein
MYFVLIFKMMRLNARRWSLAPKHVSGTDKTNTVCCGWGQNVYKFYYEIPQREGIYNKKL